MRYLISETTWPLVTLAQHLTTAGLLVTRTDRPEDIPHFLQIAPVDLLILDVAQLENKSVSLPTLRRMRPDLPIALIGDETDPEMIAKWLHAGADTVLSGNRPCDEIRTILSAIARRAHGLGRSEVVYGPLRIDVLTRKSYMNDCPIKLSPKLYELLEFMALRPGQLINRSALLGHIYGLEDEPDPRVFDVYVCNLRACLAASEGAVDIETVRGVGYRFCAPCLDDAIAA